MHIPQRLSCSVAGLVLLQGCIADRTYKSRPDLSPPRLNITVPASAQVEAGYLFVAPYGSNVDGTPQPAPYILGNDGDLVWSGFGYFAPAPANFQPARWGGKDVLFAYEGTLNPRKGHGHGHHKLLDQRYQTIREVRSAGHYLSDLHEFNIVDERTALLGSYTPRELNLTAYGGDEEQTWIIECVLQEIDIESGKLLFEWHSLDHTSPEESALPLDSMAGSGRSSATAWDYLHVNSIAKGEDGHYLISARSASTIYKINGTDGSVIWRLGGKSSDFQLGPGVEFALQHHARYVPDDLPGTTISLFDNSAGAGSAGKILSLDVDGREAKLRRAFLPPHPIFAFSQGSTQVLPGGNALVNWGSAGQVTEFDGGSGEVLFHAFLESGDRWGSTQNYRAFRGNWTGLSPETPAVVVEPAAAAADDDDGAGAGSVWVSWNGDTRTTHWRFLWDRPSGHGRAVASSSVVARTGFETRFDLPGDGPVSGVFVEALDAEGAVLIRSDVFAAEKKVGKGGASGNGELGPKIVVEYPESDQGVIRV